MENVQNLERLSEWDLNRIFEICLHTAEYTLTNERK